MRRVLITGITGFAGSHLAEFYLGYQDDPLEEEVELYGFIRHRNNREFIRHFENRVHLIEGDIADAHAVEQAVIAVRPDRIHHLAAQSLVPTSWTAPTETFQINLLGSLNLFEAVRRHRPEAILQVASSSEIYGRQEIFPISEQNLPEPLSPYAVSKLAMDRLAHQYVRSYDRNIIVTRGFNHTGPRRGSSFVTSNFAKQIVEIERRQREPIIHVGNLDMERDWTDVRDMVRAYVLAIRNCNPGEPYNIASGVSHKICGVLDNLLALAGVKATIQMDPDRKRPSDVPRSQGDSSKFQACSGWKPRIPWEQTLKDLLDYWRLTLDGKMWQAALTKQHKKEM